MVLPVDLGNQSCGGMFLCVADYVNQATSGWFWALALFGFMAVLFISTYRYGTYRAFGIAGFFGLMASVGFVTLGFMTWSVASIFIIIGVASIVPLIKASESR